jgi:hypothetical protein
MTPLEAFSHGLLIGSFLGAAIVGIAALIYTHRHFRQIQAEHQRHIDNAYAEGLKRGRSLEASTRQIRL